jgi:hypothetical protein
VRDLVSAAESIPALSDAMERRIRLLNGSVDIMEKLQARMAGWDSNLVKPDMVMELYKTMSHQFTEVLELCRRCSSDELVTRLDNLHLYQLIQNLSPEERVTLRDVLTPKKAEVIKTVDVQVSEPVYHPIESETPQEPPTL